MSAYLRDSNSTSYAKIINIYVPSDFRRKGIGTKLLEEIRNRQH